MSQQILLGTGGVKKKTYMDDVFSTFLYKGNGSARSINNGIDLSGEGGLVWLKSRTNSIGQLLYDTERGATKYIFSSDNSAEDTFSTLGVTQFNNNGFNLGSHDSANDSSHDHASWSFRKASGFFDVVTFTGDNSSTTQTISHNLGSIPGMILLKPLNTSPWRVYHKSLGTGDSKMLCLSTDDVAHGFNTDPDNNTFVTVTSTNITIRGQIGSVDYVAYVFAGGESTAATARSVDFDGNDDLTIASDSDFNYGTGDFTWELWVKLASSPGTEYLIDHSDSNNGGTLHYHGGQIRYLNPTTGTSSALYTDGGSLTAGTWHHVAVVRNSGTTTIYVDGAKRTSASDSHNYPDNKLWIARRPDGQYLTGSISNFRIVKGTAVYTSSFKPPTEPLTNITNTVLLCCQNSQASYATVSPSSITAGGDPTVSDSISPFDDPAAFTFGENEDQGIIKCGSYLGDGYADGPEIDLGWEPQWLLIKRATGSAADWVLFDSMRGVATGANDSFTEPNTSDTEVTNLNYVSFTSTGFKLTAVSGPTNATDETYVYMAIRRPDGYVDKLVETATNVFAMDTGNGSSTIPNYDSGFITDFAIYTQLSTTDPRWTTARLIGTNELKANDTVAQSAYAANTWDSNVGWNKNGSSAHQSWMWKRHAGFDVVTYTGNGSAGRGIPHSMNKIPEMMWVKYRSSSTYGWVVYHKGLNGGSSPEDYYIRLDTNGSDGAGSTMWNDTAPTSTVFTVGTNPGTNSNTADYIAMLFASVDGISKCGFYDGSDSDQTITTGFQPRLLLVKRTNDTQAWTLLDTVRGWAQSTNDPRLELNANVAQITNVDFGYPTSTGFVLEGGTGKMNESGGKFIYYAHA